MVRRSQRREERGKGRWGHAMPGHVLTQRTAAVHANSLTARERTNLELGGGLVKPLLKFPNAAMAVAAAPPAAGAAGAGALEGALAAGAPPPNEKVDDAGALAAGAPPPNEKLGAAVPKPPPLPPEGATRATDANGLALGAEAAESPSVAPPRAA